MYSLPRSSRLISCLVMTLVLCAQSWSLPPGDKPAASDQKDLAAINALSQKDIAACMKNDELQKKIVAERYQAEKEYGVDSTPTFFINGVKFVGAQPFPEFDKALAQAASKS